MLLSVKNLFFLGYSGAARKRKILFLFRTLYGNLCSVKRSGKYRSFYEKGKRFAAGVRREKVATLVRHTWFRLAASQGTLLEVPGCDEMKPR